jgi:porin
VADGGLRRKVLYTDLLEPTATVNLDKLLGWPDARLYVRGLGTYGADPAEATGSRHAPSNVAAPNTFRLFEGWLEQRLLDDRLAILVGLYALDTEFDVKETAGVFMNGGFGTGLDLSQSGDNGPCIFPVSCLGIRVRVQPTPSLYVQAAVLDGVAGDPDDPRGTQVDLDADDGVLVIGEVGYRRGADAGRFVRAAVGGWTYTKRFDDLVEVGAGGEPRQRHGTWGVYALAEGELYREPDQRTRGLSAFARVGMADPHVSQFAWYAGGGLAYTGLVPGRDEDVTGLGVSVAINGADYKRAQRRAGVPVSDQEVAVEWTYRAQILPWMAWQLDVQYLVDPGTDHRIRHAMVIGLRYRIVF